MLKAQPCPTRTHCSLVTTGAYLIAFAALGLAGCQHGSEPTIALTGHPSANESVASSLTATEPQRSEEWPSGWAFAAKAFRLFDKPASSLELLGEPDRRASSPIGHMYTWRRRGTHAFNGTSRPGEPLTDLWVEVNSSSQRVASIEYWISTKTAAGQVAWDLSMAQAMRLLGADPKQAKTHWTRDTFGGYFVVAVVPRQDHAVMMVASTSKLFEQSSKTGFGSGQVAVSTKVAPGVSLSTLVVHRLYLGSRSMKFSLYRGVSAGVDYQDLLDLKLPKVDLELDKVR